MKKMANWNLKAASGIAAGIRGAEDIYRWRLPYSLMFKREDTPLVPFEKLMGDMGEQAVRMRLTLKRPDGSMPDRMDVKRYFIVSERIFSITVQFLFMDMGNGIFGAYIYDEDKDRLKYFDQTQRMFLN